MHIVQKNFELSIESWKIKKNVYLNIIIQHPDNIFMRHIIILYKSAIVVQDASNINWL